MSDYPRRRRLEPEPPRGGGVPIVPLVILVILGGLLLGGLLTKFFGNTGGAHAPATAPTFTPLPGESAVPATASPAPSTSPSEKPSPRSKREKSPAPSPSATSSAAPRATPKATAKPAVAARSLATPSARPTAPPSVIILTPTPASASTPFAAPALPSPSPSPAGTATPVGITGANSNEHASAIVRSYIGALANGDSATATGYLASGIPTESFINPNVNVQVTNMQTARNGDGSFTVTAQIQTAKGSYLETFTLRSGPYGMQITDHNATRM